MQGSVYQLSLTDQDGAYPHPHVVVLTFSGNRDCIIVPAYSPDGFKINEYIGLCKKEGLSEDQIFVRLDNAKCIDFTAFFPPKEALWCLKRFRRVSQKAVQQGKRIGQMKSAGLLEIANRLLTLAETEPDALSASAVKSLRNLVKGLTAETGAPSLPPVGCTTTAT